MREQKVAGAARVRSGPLARAEVDWLDPYEAGPSHRTSYWK